MTGLASAAHRENIDDRRLRLRGPNVEVWHPSALRWPGEAILMGTLRRTAGSIARRVGLKRSRPAPTRQRLAADSPAIAWTYPEGGGSFDQRVDVFRRLLALFPAGHLVDLACGTGIFSIAAHEMGWDVTAVDARTERMPMTPGIAWVQQDVREVDVTGYDVIALLGLLYHLELPDQIALLQRCSATVTILDTHHSVRPTHVEGGYAGHTFRELPPDREDQLAATPTAAWGNLTSFWATQPDLVRLLQDCGFETVLALVPPNLPDRTFYVCLPPRRGGGGSPRSAGSGNNR